MSIIIVNYNVKHFLQQCLASIFQSKTNFDFEVIVVDNDSQDDSMQMVTTEFPQVICIENKTNVGFGKANNQGLARAKGEYTLFLNPDTILQEDSLQKARDYIFENENVGALGIRMIDGNGNFLPESKRSFPSPMVAFYKLFGLSTLFPKNKTFGAYHLSYLDQHRNHEVDVLSGAFFLAPTTLLQEIGGFDKDYFMYGEDIDLSFQIQKKGLKNIYFSDSSIVHYKGESTKKGSLNYVRHFYSAMIIFAQKHLKSNKGFFVNVMRLAIVFRAVWTLVLSFFQSLGLVLADLGFSVLFMFGAIEFILSQKPNFDSYPLELYQINFPIYLLLGFVSMYFSGAYDRPYQFSKLFRGGIVTLLSIALIYSFFPAELRFSRSFVLFTAIGFGLAYTLNRMILQFVENRSFSFYKGRKKNFMVVGNPQSETIKEVILQNSPYSTYLGLLPIETLLSLSKNEERELKEQNVTDIIVDTSVIPYKDFVNALDHFQDQNIRFHTTSDLGATLISSQNKNRQGSIQNFEKEFKLGTQSERRKKRLFDVIASLTLGILLPFSLWFQKEKANHVKHIWDVLIGKKTWVGYLTMNQKDLPIIKPSILGPNGPKHTKWSSPEVHETMDIRYAKFYNVYHDIDLILSYWNRL